ncbi:hypothetical protein F9C11_30365 [Amycolatopsis sp. VS8301801F10]|uniref:hypothetical protein n=1 Tax=Amycolatopsis sp. VS8301801F10 TaxID=2652442 RepID=UPI0038FBF1C4
MRGPVRSIPENPRYAFFERWAWQEMLLDPDDAAAGPPSRTSLRCSCLARRAASKLGGSSYEA